MYKFGGVKLISYANYFSPNRNSFQLVDGRYVTVRRKRVFSI